MAALKLIQPLPIMSEHQGRNQWTRGSIPPSSDPTAARRRARKRMIRHLGRALSVNEHVHHIDGNYLNDDLTNLVVVDRQTHQQLHQKPIRVCNICNIKHFARGYCRFHWRRWYNGRALEGPKRGTSPKIDNDT